MLRVWPMLFVAYYQPGLMAKIASGHNHAFCINYFDVNKDFNIIIIIIKYVRSRKPRAERRRLIQRPGGRERGRCVSCWFRAVWKFESVLYLLYSSFVLFIFIPTLVETLSFVSTVVWKQNLFYTNLKFSPKKLVLNIVRNNLTFYIKIYYFSNSI